MALRQVFLGLICCALVGAAAKDAPTDKKKPDSWPVLTSKQQAAAVLELKQAAKDVAAKLGRRLELHETRLFLFYTELTPAEAERCSRLLDAMYTKLATMFDVPKDQNIWRGKALVFGFADAKGYQQFESQIAEMDPGESAGMCHCFEDGTVKVAFYRQPDDQTFAHVLVHESVHGFMHRFRGPPELPSWVNEGLAEMIAGETVPTTGGVEKIKASARDALAQHRNRIGDFFTAEHIPRWQYPVSETFTLFMISKDRKRYVEFIDALKDGASCAAALEKSYQSTAEQLIPEYARWLGANSLQP